MTSFVKVPPPRQLNQKETLDSLNHWKTSFRNYFRRDTIFKQFLSSSTTWDPNQPHYGLAPTEDVTAEDRKDALVDFLHHLAGFLPHSYLTSKLVKNTTKLEDCWDVIYEHYNVQVTPETFLDGESIRQEPNENYRQFYERLLQHAKLHLAPVDAKVDGLKNQVADKISISLMNHIAVQWLCKINTDLIQIVKTEYSTKLRSGEQLASLVPRIAPNIDSLLSRYTSTHANRVSAAVIDDNHESAESLVMYTRGRGGNSFRGRGRCGGYDGARGGGRSNFAAPFCAGCFSMAKQLNTFLDFKHKPAECPKWSLDSSKLLRKQSQMNPGTIPNHNSISDKESEEEDDTLVQKEEEKPDEIESTTGVQPAIEHLSITTKPNQEKRPRRRAAERSRSKLQDILKCLQTKSKPACKDPPLHGWIYEDWVKNIEEDDDELYVETPLKHEMEIPRKTPFSLFLDSLDFQSFTFPTQDRAQTGGLLQMFPLHEEEDESLSWDHLTSPEELIPHSEQDHSDRVLDDALTPRQLFPDNYESSLQNSIYSEDDDVFEDPSVLEVSLEGRTRTKNDGVLRSHTKSPPPLLAAVEDHDDKIEADHIKEKQENEDEADEINQKIEAEARIRTRLTPRVNYAHLHRYGRRRKDGNES